MTQYAVKTEHVNSQFNDMRKMSHRLAERARTHHTVLAHLHFRVCV